MYTILPHSNMVPHSLVWSLLKFWLAQQRIPMDKRDKYSLHDRPLRLSVLWSSVSHALLVRELPLSSALTGILKIPSHSTAHCTFRMYQFEYRIRSTFMRNWFWGTELWIVASRGGSQQYRFDFDVTGWLMQVHAYRILADCACAYRLYQALSCFQGSTSWRV